MELGPPPLVAVAVVESKCKSSNLPALSQYLRELLLYVYVAMAVEAALAGYSVEPVDILTLLLA
jgi:hypothetical protein